MLALLMLRSVNSKLFGIGLMWRVPGVSLEVRSRELALLTVLGLKRLLSVLAERFKGSCTDRESYLPAKLEEMFKVPSKISRG